MKKVALFVLTTLMQLFVLASLYAQQTGYTDSFNGDLKASGPPSFKFRQENGILNIIVDKESSKRWQGVYYSIGETIDMTAMPVMNLKMRSEKAFLLTAYIVDTANNNMTKNLKIYATETWVNYCLDFGDFAGKGVDASQIKALIFTPNGNSNDGLQALVQMDEVNIGNDAQKFAGIGGIPSQTVYTGTVQHSIPVYDLKNFSDLTAGGAPDAVTNLQVNVAYSGPSDITFDCVPGFAGTDTLTITAVGSDGYAVNTLKVPLHIRENFPPEMDNIDDMDLMVGDTVTVRLSGIDDGNTAANQVLQISAVSDNPAAIPPGNLTIDHMTGSTVADLTIIAVQAAENVQITVTLDDGGDDDHTHSVSFFADTFVEYNHPPVVNFIPDQFAYLQQGEQTVAITGIGDGDDGSQNLALTATSSNVDVLPNDNIVINYTPGAATADFRFTALNTGITTINLTITDDGGTAANNGDARIKTGFDVEIGNLPPTGHTPDMAAFDTTNAEIIDNVGDWKIEGNLSAQVCELGTFHGKDDVIKIDITAKSCWTGLWYRCPELDADRHRFLCYDIYFEGGSFDSNPGQTHSYLWDADEQRNLPGGHAQRKTVPAGEWRTVFMDYRGPEGMINNDGVEINTRRIQKVLINYASSFGWPFPSDDGTVYITNIKLGGDVPKDLVPVVIPRCTLDPIADQTLFPGAGEQTIELTGISDGHYGQRETTVTASSDNTDFIPDPQVSDVTGDGTAMLTFTGPDKTGSATITVTASAEASRNRTRSFTVAVIDDGPGGVAVVHLDRDSLFQTMRGFGTFSFGNRQNYIDYYTKDLGASAIRMGIISNQIEWVNDNNDPNVLDITAFDHSAFDFNYFRELKNAGVETFILTSWSPPAWMKRNMSVGYGYASAPNYEDTDCILEPYYYEEFAESMVAAVKMFKDNAGIDLFALGPQNEPAFTEPYASAVLSPDAFADLVTVVGKRFEREGLATKLYMPEQVFSQGHYSMVEYMDALITYPEADMFTDIIATHGYDTDGVGEKQPTYDGWTTMWERSQDCRYAKEFWMTETFPAYRNWDSALSLAGAIHGALVYGNVGLWTLWSIEGTLMDKGRPTASFYTSKNYYKYIRPGARRIQAESDHSDILASSFIHPELKTLTTVLINKSAEPVSTGLTGNRLADRYDVYTTAEYMNFEFRGIVESGAPVALPGRSVTTLLGYIQGPVHVANNNQPHAFRVDQNYPNPFNPLTRISFYVPVATDVSVTVYNILGQKVRTLMDRRVSPGEFVLKWDGTSDTGVPVAGGMYFYRFKAQEHVSVKKCILLK